MGKGSHKQNNKKQARDLKCTSEGYGSIQQVTVSVLTGRPTKHITAQWGASPGKAVG